MLVGQVGSKEVNPASLLRSFRDGDAAGAFHYLDR